jgi:hypothetical protein
MVDIDMMPSFSKVVIPLLFSGDENRLKTAVNQTCLSDPLRINLTTSGNPLVGKHLNQLVVFEIKTEQTLCHAISTKGERVAKLTKWLKIKAFKPILKTNLIWRAIKKREKLLT